MPAPRKYDQQRQPTMVPSSSPCTAVKSTASGKEDCPPPSLVVGSIPIRQGMSIVPEQRRTLPQAGDAAQSPGACCAQP